MISTRATAADGAEARKRLVAARAARDIDFVLVPLAAFAVYWLSSLLIEAANATILFGSDAPLYTWLLRGELVDRVTRFHPVTVVLELAWMKLLAPLTLWIAPQNLLKALFATIGAVGVWAAMWAFRAVIPRRQVVLWGVIYAASFGIWFFSSIEESKIVTATLSTLYIAIYLHLRQHWSMRGAVLLTLVLLLDCLNEIVAGFLVAIPIVDALLERGWDRRALRWIAAHALTAPVAFAFLELVVNGYLVAATDDPEGASHLSMLFYYASDNKLDAWTVDYFLANWLFYNLAAPTSYASQVFPHWPNNKYFDPELTNYFSSPISAALAVLFGVMVLASFLRRHHAASPRGCASILLALLAYAALRGAFFFAVYPYESLLFSSSVTLAHLLLIAIPFAASRLPAKETLLGAVALLLIVTNGTFIVSQ
ncbi:MAG: hypothetical protein J2P50_02635 [Hyphomicrobiaceae bacterium]|nr:hypothetical protein [Hyphomicrobiaceae bacterium]